MKKNILLLASFFALTSHAQEQPISVPEDTLITLSKSFGISEKWDFTNTLFSKYPNTTDSDLVRLKDPVAFYANQPFLKMGDSITQALPSRTFSQKDITLTRAGSFTAVHQGQGTLLFYGQAFTNVEKIKIVERYHLAFTGDSLPMASYENTYYTFFDKATKNHLFSVFEKKRQLKGGFGNSYVGIGYSAATNNPANFTQANIQMSLVPNPASGATTLSYNLVGSAKVKIELTNQAGSINTLLFNDMRDAGLQQKVISLQGYQSGVYTIKLTVEGIVFSQVLIIQ